MVGAIVGKILPDWILTLALVTLLAHTTYTTLDKARSQYIKETKTMLAQSTEAIRSIMQQTLEEAQEEVERESLLMRDDDFDDFDDDDGYDHNSGATWAASSSSATEQGRVTEGKIKKGRAIEMTAFGDSATGPSEAFLTGSSLDSLSESNSNPNTTKGILGRRDDNDISDSNLEMDLFEKEIHLTNAVDDEKKRTQELRSLLKQERQTPVDRVLVMSAMVVVVVGINLVKGGGAHFPSVLGIECGSFWYWGLTAVVIIVILLVSLWARGELITKWLLKSRLHYKYLEGDIEWNYRNTVLYPCICVFAGLFAGMFGIGGGVVKGPLMLHMGVHPLVASATVAVMIMFTSVSATAMFVAFGTLQWDYAWFLFALGLVSTVVGQFGVSYFVDKYKRYSFISISIGSVVAISTILMGLQSIFELVDPTPIQGTESSSLC